MYLTRFTGKVLYKFEELNSTLDYASELIAKSKPPHGTAIITEHQTEGRGQFGRSWSSLPGQNLLLSVIFYPKKMNSNQIALFNMAMATAVIDFLKIYDIDAMAKWPNDIVYGEKKIAGLLHTSQITGGIINYIIAGMGINVNQKVWPSSLDREPCSMVDITGNSLKVDKLLPPLFHCIEKKYLKFEKESDAVLEEYHHCMYKKDDEADLELSSTSGFINYKIKGVSKEGLLKVEKDGRNFSCPPGQVKWK